MAEWSNAAVLKTAEPETVPGFESLSFRHFTNSSNQDKSQDERSTEYPSMRATVLTL